MDVSYIDAPRRRPRENTLRKAYSLRMVSAIVRLIDSGLCVVFEFSLLAFVMICSTSHMGKPRWLCRLCASVIPRSSSSRSTISRMIAVVTVRRFVSIDAIFDRLGDLVSQILSDTRFLDERVCDLASIPRVDLLA